MSGSRTSQGGRELPAEIEVVIHEVLASAELDLITGRDEVEDELRSHFEDGLAAGHSVEEMIDRFGDPVAAGRRIARARARRTAGGSEASRGMGARIGLLASELRYAARRLRRSPGFALIVVLTLGLGVGANTAIFTVLDSVLLEALPYAEPDRLVRVYESEVDDPSFEFVRAPIATEWMTWDEVFDDVSTLYTYRENGADLTGDPGTAPRRVRLMRASAGYFETLGVAPAFGRTFLPDESFGPAEPESAPAPSAPVAVLAHDFWADAFGADPDVLGRTIDLNGAPHEVVGVMPHGFNNPIGSPSDVWVPQNMRLGGSNSFGNYYLSVVARLRDGVSVEQAQDRLRTLSAGFAEEQPAAGDEFARIVPLKTDVVGARRRAMLMLLAGAAGLVLLTACVNVANLLVARGFGRGRDLALRSALGSGRGRLLATLLSESALLAVAGGLVGLALGWAGVRALLAGTANVLPIVSRIELDLSVFLFALVVTTGALLVFGVLPALRLSRTSPSDVLRSGDRSATSGRALRRVRDGLVVVQIGAALALVTGAVLLTRSFDALVDVPLGVEPEGVLTFEVHLPESRYPTPGDREAFHRTFHDRVAELPPVEAIGATSWLPANGRYHTWGIGWNGGIPDPNALTDDDWYGTDVRIIAGDYFEALGIDVVRGVSPGDIDPDGPPVAWVNQTLADQVFEGVDPLEEQLFLSGQIRRIAGIVEDLPHSPTGDVFRQTFLLHSQADNRNWALIQTVRARSDLGAAQSEINAVLRSIDPQLVLYRPRAMTSVLEGVRAQERFSAILMGVFALLALTLSLVGTYGVLAGTVSSRTREIGIRIALGADRGSVRAMVLRYAGGLTSAGIVLGVVAAWIGGRWIESLLFGVSVSDPVAYGLSIGAFLALGLISGWLPAVRATRVDAVEAIGVE